MPARKPKPMHELHVRALFEEACAKQGLIGEKIEEAAETFIQFAFERGVEITMPKKAHLILGVGKSNKPRA